MLRAVHCRQIGYYYLVAEVAEVVAAAVVGVVVAASSFEEGVEIRRLRQE